MASSNCGSLCKALLSGRTCAGFRVYRPGFSGHKMLLCDRRYWGECGEPFAPGLSPWIMMRSATDLSKADLHVFSKLFDDGLERGQEAKAFSWRQIGGHDDVLDFFVGHLINVEMTRQPAP